MRHAKSAWDTPAPTDFDRPLAPRGRRDAPRMAAWLADEDLLPDRVITSSALRAQMTIEPLVRLAAPSVTVDDALYGASARQWIETLIHVRDERVLICGHNPGLDDLVESISDGPVPFTDNGKLMTTAAIAVLRIDGGWSGLGRGAASLTQLMRPRELPRT